MLPPLFTFLRLIFPLPLVDSDRPTNRTRICVRLPKRILRFGLESSQNRLLKRTPVSHSHSQKRRKETDQKLSRTSPKRRSLFKEITRIFQLEHRSGCSRRSRSVRRYTRYHHLSKICMNITKPNIGAVKEGNTHGSTKRMRPKHPEPRDLPREHPELFLDAV